MQRLMSIAAALLVTVPSVHSQSVFEESPRSGSEFSARSGPVASPLTASVLNGGLLDFRNQSLAPVGQRGSDEVMSLAASRKCRYVRAAALGFGIGFAVGLAGGYADREWHITSDDPGSPWLLAAGLGALGAFVGLMLESGEASGTGRCG